MAAYKPGQRFSVARHGVLLALVVWLELAYAGPDQVWVDAGEGSRLSGPWWHYVVATVAYLVVFVVLGYATDRWRGEGQVSSANNSLFVWPNRVALAAFLFVFAGGIFKGNSFGGFVLGLFSAGVWWLLALAGVKTVRLFRGTANGNASAAVTMAPTKEAVPATSDTIKSPYLIALRELEEERPDEAILAESYAISDGDPDRTRAAYLRLRAKQLEET